VSSRASCKEGQSSAGLSQDQEAAIHPVAYQGADDDWREAFAYTILIRYNKNKSVDSMYVCGGISISSEAIATCRRCWSPYLKKCKNGWWNTCGSIDLQDELEWDALFERTREQLVAAARRAKEEIAPGKAEPMDFERL